MRNLEWQSDAWEEYLEIQKTDKTLLKKVNKLIKDIMRNGYLCSEGKPEMLKGDLSGYASVRMDKKNRLVLRILSVIGINLVHMLCTRKSPSLHPWEKDPVQDISLVPDKQNSASSAL